MALSPDLAVWLRSQGHDAVHASDLALNRAADTQILSIARDDGRVVISADLDFPRLLALAGAAGPGLILLRKRQLQRSRKPGMRPARTDVRGGGGSSKVD